MGEITERPINEVVAENLAYWMSQHATLKTQSALAAASGVAQTTIGNYLNPKQRLESAKGKQPSAKLTELAMIAAALDIGVWTLVRPATPREREFYAEVEKAYKKAVETDPRGITGNTRPGELDEPPTRRPPKRRPPKRPKK